MKNEKRINIVILFFINFLIISLNQKSFANFFKKEVNNIISKEKITKTKSKNTKISKIKWDKLDIRSNPKEIIWENFTGEINNNLYPKSIKTIHKTVLNSLNRSIIFDNQLVGPDISWIVPLGFSWNKKFKFDFHARGHNTQIPEPEKKKFFSWNDGDAIGLISYQFLHNKKSSFGLNFGVRSLYQGDNALGGGTKIGEGTSAGFRWDYALSESSGIALGAEQFIHFDKTTDTGRNIYFTASKGWWSSNSEGEESFPLYAATAGVGTGRLAVGNIKGLCSDLFDGSGTETNQKRPLCWSPIFSVAGIWNEKFSTFLEYNSRFFILGNSLTPFQNIPIRGTFGLMISDHIDNYKVHNFEELNWVFNLSLGF